MLTLNKDNQAAIEYVSNFINGQWQDNKYVNIGYNSIDTTAYRKFCLEEQGNVCCYCGRKIDNSKSTELEHIIPRAKETKQSTLDKYFAYAQILADNVVLQSVFTDATERRAPPPFPHHIAYHNIVASCDGKIKSTSEDFTCCNRKREDKFVPPFNLMPNSIAYLNDGTVYYVNDELDNRFINPLNLNKDLLKKIRRVWYLFSKSDATENEIISVTNETEIKEIIALHLDVNPLKSVVDGKIIDSFKILTNWNTLLKYKYFLTYFRKNN